MKDFFRPCIWYGPEGFHQGSFPAIELICPHTSVMFSEQEEAGSSLIQMQEVASNDYILVQWQMNTSDS